MARSKTVSYAATGAAIGGILYLLSRIRIIGFAFWLLGMYLVFSVVYDTFISERILPDGIQGVYDWQVTEVEYPDLTFSRQNPQFTVHGILTNHSDDMLQRWVLEGKLYDCPTEFASIDRCRYVTRWGTAVDAQLKAGHSEEFTQVVNFWQGEETRYYARAVWSIERVVMDSDA